MNSPIVKSVTIRFLKGFVTGALGSLTAFTISNINTWTDFKSAFFTLSFSVVSGGITGGVLALEKYFNWDVTPSITN